MPFLVDSIGLALTQRALTLHFLAHPIFAVRATARALLRSDRASAARAPTSASALESFQHIEVDRIVDPAALLRCARRSSAACATCAWRAPTGPRCAPPRGSTADDLSSLSARFDPRDVSEAQRAARLDGGPALHLSGLPRISAAGRKGRERLQPVEATGLGLLRRGHKRPRAPAAFWRATSAAKAAPAISSSSPRRTAVDGASRRLSRLRRRQTFRRQGPADRRAALSGTVDFGGLQHQPARDPRWCATRWRRWWSTSRSPPTATTARRCSTSWNLSRATSCSRPASRTDPHRHRHLRPAGAAARAAAAAPRPFRRFYSCLIFVPREKYNTQVRQRIERVIAKPSAFSMESQVQIAESNLARIHIVARTCRRRGRASTRRAWNGASPPRCAPGWTLQDRAAGALRRGLCAAALRDLRAGVPRRLYGGFSGRRRRLDVSFLEAAEKEPERLHLDIYRPEPRRKDKLFLKIFRGQDAIPISDLLPMLENMGLKVIAERPYGLEFPGGRRAWIQDLELLMQGRRGREVRERWSARSRARSRPCGPAAWTATASIS
jgi:glutamate dehydrogenase